MLQPSLHYNEVKNTLKNPNEISVYQEKYQGEKGFKHRAQQRHFWKTVTTTNSWAQHWISSFLALPFLLHCKNNTEGIAVSKQGQSCRLRLSCNTEFPKECCFLEHQPPFEAYYVRPDSKYHKGGRHHDLRQSSLPYLQWGRAYE